MKATKYPPAASTTCPDCGARVRYYAFSTMGNVCPHFYCDQCSNVFHRLSDFGRIHGREPSADLLSEIAAALPGCPCGGRFRAGANVKCPHCRHEWPHRADAVARIFDADAIIVEGASLLTEE